ncbi:MAG: hypothetical protein FJW39_23840 [Acidobacteria bacterium]|nr:hypothetical protein [Acidobacteriota bacterium]
MKIALLLYGSVAAASEAWVRDLGGSLVKDEAGQVVEVSLRAAWTGDGDLRRLAAFPKLRKLDLSHTHINDGALEHLKALPHLIWLDLSFAEHITDAGLARLRPLPRLERLSLEGARVSDSGVGSIAALVNLRALNLKSTLITDSAIEQLEPLTQLEELAIGANRIAGFGLVYLQVLPRLKHLDLSGVQLTDDGIWSVALTDLNIEAVAGLVQLESLNLASTELTGVATIPDGGIRESTAIQITDLGIEKLATLRNLRRLDLSRAQVTARGLRILAALPRLESLGLAHTTTLDGEAMAVLKQMSGLRNVDLSGTERAR